MKRLFPIFSCFLFAHVVVSASAEEPTAAVQVAPATEPAGEAEATEPSAPAPATAPSGRLTAADQKAMAEALEAGRVKTYISDFANPVSVHMKNAVILPHLGASTNEAEDNCAVMAVDELQNYLDNGNISHSVNFPEINAGVCETEARVAVLHRNVPTMLSQITAFFGASGLNIENLANKARGEYAYTLLDLAHPMPHDTVESLKKIGGVIRVRRISERG